MRGGGTTVAAFFSEGEGDETPKKVVRPSLEFVDAIRAGDVAKVKKCLMRGASVKKEDRMGRTPLWEAVYAGRLPIVKLLIDYNSATNVCDIEGWSVLTVACVLGMEEVLRMLIRAGAVADWNPGHGRTPLMVLASGATPALLPPQEITYESKEFTVLGPVRDDSSVGKGSFVQVVAERDPALRGARGSVAAAEMDACRARCAEILLDSGANPNNTCMKRAGNYTALVLASINGQAGIVHVLLQRQVAKARTTEGSSALIWAAKYGHTNVVELLIEVGWDVNDSNNIGSTPLLLAVQGHHTDCARYLLSKGAQVCDATDEFNRNAPTLAAEMKFQDIVDLFNSQSKDKSARMLIMESNRPLLHRPSHEPFPHEAPYRSIGPQKGGEVPVMGGPNWVDVQMKRSQIAPQENFSDAKWGHHHTKW